MQRFNIYNFVGRDKYRAPLTGVYHDGGYKVASDAIVLAAVKSDYSEELEHHIISKDGQEVSAKYPNWKGCIPDGRDYQSYRVDFKEYDEFIKGRREASRSTDGKAIRWDDIWAVKVGPAYLKARHFDRFAAGMKEIGATEIYVRDERHTIYAKTDKGWVLIFPMLTEREADDPDTITLA